jgi:hypothetical protein
LRDYAEQEGESLLLILKMILPSRACDYEIHYRWLNRQNFGFWGGAEPGFFQVQALRRSGCLSNTQDLRLLGVELSLSEQSLILHCRELLNLDQLFI